MRGFLIFILSLGLVATPVLAKDNQIVAGAGPSTKTVKAFFAGFSKMPECADYNFSIMESSVKHKGGIQNSDKFLFGRTGRPLNSKEKTLGKEEIFLAKVPIAFAKGLEVNISTLSMAQIEGIYTRKILNWKDVGGPDTPILLVGREPTEALFKVLKNEFSFFEAVKFDKIFKKDHEVVAFLTSPQGRYAIAFGAKPNFGKHNLLVVNDFTSGVKLGLVYDKKKNNHPVIQAAQKYARTTAWEQQVLRLEMLTVN